MSFLLAPLSFEFADTLPSQAWEPPRLALLQLDDMTPEPGGDLQLGRLETAWAPTLQLGL